MRKSLILGISVLAMAGILWGNGKEVETQREMAVSAEEESGRPAERDCWQGIYIPKRYILCGSKNFSTLFPEAQWEETRECLIIIKDGVYIKYRPNATEEQKEAGEACQRFAVSCQWTVLEEDEAKQMDETWYQFSEGAVSLEYPDYFDLDFRCADYVGEGLLVLEWAERGEEGPHDRRFPELAWGYRIFTKEGRVFGISEVGVEEYSFFPIPSLFGIELF